MVVHPADIHKKRSRRLRKKLHVGEFQVFGFAITFTINRQLKNFDDALDGWIDYVESQSWCFGGGGSVLDNEIEGYLCRYDRGSLTESDRDLVAYWLAEQSWVTAHYLAPLSDVWYGPWEDNSIADPSTGQEAIHQRKTIATNKTGVYFPHEVVGLQIEQGFSLLAAWRCYRGLSQVELAGKLGVSLTELVAIEQPDHRFTPQQVTQLVSVLNIQVEHLLG